MYAKLVRDKIPEIIKAEGRSPNFYRCEDDEEFLSFVLQKVSEEANEVVVAAAYSNDRLKVCEEIGDLMMVLHTLATSMNIKEADMYAAMIEKANQVGGFSERYILVHGG